MTLQQITLCFLSLLLLACNKQAPSSNHTTHTDVVRMTRMHKTLHFTGTIQPLRESTLSSAMDAVVETMHYHYGQFVKKGQVVFTLNSAELQRQYNDTLTEYLKAKDSYSMSRAKFTGTEELWQAGLLSKNNYLSEKSSLSTARVTLMQTTRKLSEMLEKIGDGQLDDLSDLSFAEFDKVRQALTSKHNLIHLKSPSDGVLLYPPKAGDDRSARISVGSAIKAGQVLALIGDLSGISVDIDVPEVDIGEIKTGMPAVIRGVAFGKQELNGTLVAINAQASTASGGALPSFTAVVEVHALNKAQQAWVKVGMSTMIELAVDSSDKLLIPIAAISQKSGRRIVQVRLPNGKLREHAVITGAVSGDRVVIDDGLTVGDVLVY